MDPSIDTTEPAKKQPVDTFIYSGNVHLIQRRGSVPCDSLSVLGRNGCNGKTRNRKKILRRRSSGGAEILSPIIGDPSEAGCSSGNGGGSNVVSSTWHRFKRDITRNRSDLDALLSRRRGSLPVEMLAVSHSGEFKIHNLLWTTNSKCVYLFLA